MFNKPLDWIVLIAIVAIDLVIVLGFLLKKSRTRDHKGSFDFDQYKELELLQRGLFDKTKW